MENKTPEVLQLPERLVACVSHQGNYIGDTELFKRLFTKVGNWAGAKGLFSAETVFLSSYVNDPCDTPLDELKLDVCISIPEGTDVDDAEIQEKRLPGGSYAVMHAELTGPAEYETAWKLIVDWVEQSDYERDASRPCYELYLNNPEEHPEKHHIVEICVSVTQ